MSLIDGREEAGEDRAHQRQEIRGGILDEVGRYWYDEVHSYDLYEVEFGSS